MGTSFETLHQWPERVLEKTLEPKEELLNTEVTETEEIVPEELEKVVGGGGSYGVPDYSGI